MHWKDEKQIHCILNIWEEDGEQWFRSTVENSALNMRSDTKLNKLSPRRQRRQMEQRKKSNEFYPAVFPISLSQKGSLARKSGRRQVVQGLLGKVNT